MTNYGVPVTTGTGAILGQHREEYWDGQSCGRKLVMQISPISHMCKHCEIIEIKQTQRAAEIDMISREERGRSDSRASMDTSTDSIRFLDEHIRKGESERDAQQRVVRMELWEGRSMGSISSGKHGLDLQQMSVDSSIGPHKIFLNVSKEVTGRSVESPVSQGSDTFEAKEQVSSVWAVVEARNWQAGQPEEALMMSHLLPASLILIRQQALLIRILIDAFYNHKSTSLNCGPSRPQWSKGRHYIFSRGTPKNTTINCPRYCGTQTFTSTSSMFSRILLGMFHLMMTLR